MRELLGQILVRSGKLHPDDLQKVLEQHAASAMPLGDVLAHEGLVRTLDIYHALAFQSGVPFLDLLQNPVDEVLLRWDAHAEYVRYRFVPYRLHDGELVVAACDVSQGMRAWLEGYYGCTVRLVMTSPRDIAHTLRQVFAAELSREARVGLVRGAKHRSARMKPRMLRLPWWQRNRNTLLSLTAVMALLILVMMMQVEVVLHAVVASFAALYAITLGFKLLLMGVGLLDALRRAAWRTRATLQEAAQALTADELPLYSVLVPMYREAGNVAPLLAALEALDYPRSKLDIKLIVEADDADTLRDVLACKPSGMYDVIVVPPSLPRTKPKACNVALSMARGKLVVIFDVEDRPEPLQLRMAVAQFRSLSPRVVCLQARLNYYNREENWLTRFFALEYGGLFDFLLPAMSALRLPLPLGGTSNHFKMDALRALGGWDPFNVTEDADIGLRLVAEGFETRPLEAITLEEAPLTARAWVVQRSRWIKGYLQTWAVVMRHPRMLRRAYGWRGLLGFQLFFAGSSLVYLSAPPLWVLTVCLLIQRVFWDMPLDSTLVASCAVLLGGVVVHWVSAWIVAATSGWNSVGMVVAVLGYPLYWVLHSLASFRAVWQWMRAPYVWDKTTHGASKLK